MPTIVEMVYNIAAPPKSCACTGRAVFINLLIVYIYIRKTE